MVIILKKIKIFSKNQALKKAPKLPKKSFLRQSEAFLL